ncbi:hypothetical protein O7627_21440 [Solwaraspora sp. WMMD1047]|uniref:hypothetical protein n=1 Tax=Solwaraspora sp. WMMD1047 TaxID=3016102 RepID=UPI0024172B6E|nr:hypothetical protein [Solwaraspora sp. WMMD1047]MDG4831848.1 hypothetical protein [Solwaraspora sp. WMMD1047]
MPDLTALLAELGELHRRAEAQLAHRDPILASRESWTAMATGLRDTEALLWNTAGQIQPGWTDVAGQSYLDRMEVSTAVVRAWQATLADSGVQESMTGLAAEIDATVTRVRELRQTADALVGQLASIAGPYPDPVTAGNMTLLASVYIGQLENTVAEARAALAALDQAFGDAAGVVARTPAGVAWDGPAGAGDAATTMGLPGGAAGAGPAGGGAAGPGAGGAAQTTAAGPAAGVAGVAGGQPVPADLGAAGAPTGGAGAAGGAVPAAGGAAGPAGAAAPGAAGDPTGLARAAAPPAPVTGVSPGTIGGAGVPPPAAGAAGPVPVIPPAGRPPAIAPVPGGGLVPGAGTPRPVLPGAGTPRPVLPGAGTPRPVLPGAIGGGGGRPGGLGVGAGVADTGATTIPRAAAPVGAVPPTGAGTPPAAGAGGAAGAATTGPTGGGFVRPPLGMVPPLAAGLGAGGGTPTAGTADDRSRSHRDRPLRTVPGVPPRLGGRAGPPVGSLPFGRPAAADEDADQVLDDELWQVRRPAPDDARSRTAGTSCAT